MTAPDSALQQRVTDLIRDTLGIEVPSPSEDLIESGLLDSLAVVSLMAEIEVAFDIVLALDQFDLDVFRSVTRICAFLDAIPIEVSR